jgi:hypothetical protein
MGHGPGDAGDRHGEEEEPGDLFGEWRHDLFSFWYWVRIVLRKIGRLFQNVTVMRERSFADTRSQGILRPTVFA